MREGYRGRIEMDESYFGVGGIRKGIRGRVFCLRYLLYLRE